MLRRQAAERKKSASENEGVTVTEVLANINIRHETELLVLWKESPNHRRPLEDLWTFKS